MMSVIMLNVKFLIVNMLNFIILSVIMLNVKLLNIKLLIVNMLNFNVLSVIMLMSHMFSVTNADCHYAQCHTC